MNTDTRPQEEQRSPVMVGVSSLLVIFSVLCLTVFAMLSLTTVQMDKRLTGSMVEAVSERAQADAEAHRILADLREGRVPQGETADGSVYSYSCRLSEMSQLSVEVEVNGPDYRILRWQEETAGEWVPDDSIDVWHP